MVAVVMFLRVTALPLAGLCVYQHTGRWVDGIAAALVLWVLMPEHKA